MDEALPSDFRKLISDEVQPVIDGLFSPILAAEKCTSNNPTTFSRQEWIDKARSIAKDRNYPEIDNRDWEDGIERWRFRKWLIPAGEPSNPSNDVSSISTMKEGSLVPDDEPSKSLQFAGYTNNGHWNMQDRKDFQTWEDYCDYVCLKDFGQQLFMMRRLSDSSPVFLFFNVAFNVRDLLRRAVLQDHDWKELENEPKLDTTRTPFNDYGAVDWLMPRMEYVHREKTWERVTTNAILEVYDLNVLLFTELRREFEIIRDQTEDLIGLASRFSFRRTLGAFNKFEKAFTAFHAGLIGKIWIAEVIRAERTKQNKPVDKGTEIETFDESPRGPGRLPSISDAERQEMLDFIEKWNQTNLTLNEFAKEKGKTKDWAKRASQTSRNAKRRKRRQ